MTPLLNLTVRRAAAALPILNTWTTWMRAQNMSETTIENRVGLVYAVSMQEGHPPETLLVDNVLSYLAGAQIAASSRRTYHVALQSWFRWLVDAGVRDENPMDQLTTPKASRRTPRFIQTAHVAHLLESRIHARTRSMVLLMGYQGLRVSEVAKFNGFRDIDLVSKELRVIGKGDVEAVLPLHPIIEAEAERYERGWWFPQWTSNRASRSGGHILGASVSSIVGAAMRRYGIPGTAHSLRHWHATEMLRAGVDIRVIQQLMRHASLATTQLYTHVDDTQRRAGLLLLPDVTRPDGPVECGKAVERLPEAA